MKPAEYLEQQVKASGFSWRDWYRKIYLKSDHWADLRKVALEKAKFRCSHCECGGTLDVHHENYKSIYDVTQSDLSVLCRRCHIAEHEGHKDIRQANRKPRKQKSKEHQKPVVSKKKSKLQRRRLAEAYNRGKREAVGEGVNRVAGGYAMVCRVADGLGELSESAKDYIAKIKKSLDDLTAPKKPRGIDGISKLATGIKKLF
jgi:hypothetical protein